MRKLILILTVLFIAQFSVTAQSVSLPSECINILNKNYKGWKMANIAKDVRAWHQESKQPFQPNLIKGDWNGDKKTDYAVLVERNKTRFTIAFIRKTSGYSFYKLDGEDYIGLMKKGEKDYDYESDKNFVYKNDAIFVGVFEKSGISYIWRKGKFISLVTSD